MIQAAFIQMLIKPKQGDSLNISDRIIKFSYDESIEKDNMVEISIVSSYTELIVDVEDLQEGSELIYRFGYGNGSVSLTHKVIVTDIEHTFDHRNINLLIRGLDKGSVLKKTSSPQMYENVTSTDIAKLIAARHGLDFRVDNTTKVWEKQPQGNLDDLTFLRKLASAEKSGNYIVYIKDGILHFVRRGLDTESLITYTYGEGNNGILKFKPTWRESTASPESIGSSATSFDPLEGLFNIGKETSEGENENIATGDYHLVYSSEGEHLANGTDNENISVPTETGGGLASGAIAGFEGLLGGTFVDGSDTNDLQESGLDKVVKTGKQFVSAATGIDLSDKVAGVKKAGTQKILTATLTVVGNPLLKVDALITMANVTKRYNGNWYVVSCKHTISSSGYITVLELNRNASKKAIKGKTTKKALISNDTVGDKEGVKDEIILLEFDANGNRTSDITQANNYVPPQKI